MTLPAFRRPGRWDNVCGMARVRVEELLGAPVLLRGIQLGRAVDVILDRDRRRALGFEIHCGDESRRFLPLPVVRLADARIELASPLVLLEARELAFYARSGSTLSTLRHSGVDVDGKPAGRLEDLVLDPDGTIAEIVVGTTSGLRRMQYGPGVLLVPERRSVRAAS